MAYYRLYMLTRGGGHIQAFQEIDAADDAEAGRVAEAQLGPQPLELWCGKRKVKSFAAEAQVPAQ